MSSSATPFLVDAPDSVEGWASQFDIVSLPILARTAYEIDDVRDYEDQIDAHGLADIISGDPLMTLKVFAHLGRLRRDAEGGPETVMGALMMLGIPPFFRAFGPQQTVEEILEDQAEALEGFTDVLKRARRSAKFALAFSVHRMDQDATQIHAATVLHNFAELLLWIRAPSIAIRLKRLQKERPTMRSLDAQKEILHIELQELQWELIRRWHVPPRLLIPGDEGLQSSSAHAKTIELAIRIARHSARGWDNPAIPDDISEISDLLQIGHEPTRRLLHEIDS